MKMRITVVALAAVLATPALAQTAQNQPRDPSAYTREQNGNPSEYQSRARVHPSTSQRNDVYDVRGRYVGSDPDAQVRSQLQQDPTQGAE